MYLDFNNLEGYIVEVVTTVSKVIDNVIKLDNNDVFICEENMESSIFEFDDVVVFKEIVDKYFWMRHIDLYARMKDRIHSNSSLLEEINQAVSYAEEQIDKIGNNVIESYKLLINDGIYEVEKKS